MSLRMPGIPHAVAATTISPARPAPGPVISAVLAMALLAACGGGAEPGGRAHLAGSFSVAEALDAGGDLGGFEVVVLATPGGELDTLAVAVSDSAGSFAGTVRVPERGVYPIVISRAGRRLHIDEIVLADGDSIRLRAEFPLDARRLRIVSRENSAWSAYRNAKALYNRSVLELLESGTYTDFTMRRTATQSATILWSLRELYPGTLGATVAETEAVVLLESWNDSLAVARFRSLGAEHPGIVALASAARRSTARLEGQEAAIALLRSIADSVSSADALAIRSEIVLARRDSMQRTEALAEARSLLADGRGTEWERWAGNAIYELENLMPGMPAPAFSAIDVNGMPVDLGRFAGRTLLLEFFRPGDETYLRELPARRALLDALRGRRFAALSVSVEPDSALNEALLDGRNLLGTFVFDPDGLEGSLARAYNVNLVPTRVLIGPDGRLISRYTGPAIGAVRNDLAGIFGSGFAGR